MTEPLARVCATCRQPLTLAELTFKDGREEQQWLHGTHVDHEPVPVPRIDMDESRLHLVCDFCMKVSDRETMWLHPATPFGLEGHDGTTSRSAIDGGDGWAACKVCHRLIEAGDRDRLAARAASVAEAREPGRYPYENLLLFSTQAHDLFFLTRNGPPFPATDFLGPDA